MRRDAKEGRRGGGDDGPADAPGTEHKPVICARGTQLERTIGFHARPLDASAASRVASRRTNVTGAHACGP